MYIKKVITIDRKKLCYDRPNNEGLDPKTVKIYKLSVPLSLDMRLSCNRAGCQCWAQQ